MIEAFPETFTRQRAESASFWRLITTPPLSGPENMACDIDTLDAVENRGAAPTFRLFSFASPTVSYGRLQKIENLRSKIPPPWQSVQRPTGGGIVFHENDQCLSLCWRNGQLPLPRSPREQYRWIHTQIRNALRTDAVRLACCSDTPTEETAFETRECFNQPAGFDLLLGTVKIAGGALYRRRGATLYQGSIQGSHGEDLADRLERTFRSALS